jgi:hypothetical protein
MYKDYGPLECDSMQFGREVSTFEKIIAASIASINPMKRWQVPPNLCDQSIKLHGNTSYSLL